MADEAKTAPTGSGAAIVSEPFIALVLKDGDAGTAVTNAVSAHQDTSKPASTPTLPSNTGSNEENTPPPNRRPLFSSMREALESSGQVKEEPGGYVIKRHSGRQQQQFRCAEGASRPKYRHAKQRSVKVETLAAAAPGPEDEADAAGYTVIRRRSSCDESFSSNASASASAAPSHSARRNPRARGSKQQQQQQQQQRPRRGSMSTLPQSSSSLRASVAPPPPPPPPSASSVPPGFQPLRPPPGLTPAASGWVVKAAAPAKGASKIKEPPVEALWPEMKRTGKTPSGWAAATSESAGLQAQAWPAASASASSSTAQKEGDSMDDDDLLARLGVTL